MVPEGIGRTDLVWERTAAQGYMAAGKEPDTEAAGDCKGRCSS